MPERDSSLDDALESVLRQRIHRRLAAFQAQGSFIPMYSINDAVEAGAAVGMDGVRHYAAKAKAFRERNDLALAAIDGWLESDADGLLKAEYVNNFMRYVRTQLTDKKEHNENVAQEKG